MRLNVTKLRLEKQRLGIKLLSGCGISLRLERFASQKFLSSYATGFVSQSHDLFRNTYHFFRAIEPVQGRLDPEFHVVCNAREVFPGLRELGIAFPQGRAPPASVKEVIVE